MAVSIVVNTVYTRVGKMFDWCGHIGLEHVPDGAAADGFCFVEPSRNQRKVKPIAMFCSSDLNVDVFNWEIHFQFRFFFVHENIYTYYFFHTVTQ